jgi:hypothetical protein
MIRRRQKRLSDVTNSRESDDDEEEEEDEGGEEEEEEEEAEEKKDKKECWHVLALGSYGARRRRTAQTCLPPHPVLAPALARGVCRAPTVSLVHIRSFTPLVPDPNVAFVPTPTKPSTLNPIP